MNTWWLISYRWYYHVRPWETSTSPTITPWLNILSPENVTVTTELGDPIDRWTVPGTVEAPKFIWLVVFPYPSEKYDLVKVSWDGWNFPTEWKVMKNSMVPVTTNQKVYEFKVDTVHTDLFRVTHAQMFSPFFSPSYWHPGILAPRSSCWTQCHCRWPLSTETTGSYSSTGWKGMASGNLSKSKKPGKKSAKKMQPVG